jgi:hypothetical protein
MSQSLIRLFVALAALSAIACAKKDNSLAARSIVRPAGTSAPAVDATAQNLGININWDKTEILSSDPTSATLQHTYTINGKSQTFQQVLNVTAGDCSDAYNMSYDAEMINYNEKTPTTVYTALGSTACYDGVDIYAGLSFMAWTTSTVTQQFVLLNISDATATQIQKQVVPFSSAVYLPDWVSSQFN